MLWVFFWGGGGQGFFSTFLKKYFLSWVPNLKIEELQSRQECKGQRPPCSHLKQWEDLGFQSLKDLGLNAGLDTCFFHVLLWIYLLLIQCQHLALTGIYLLLQFNLRYSILVRLVQKSQELFMVLIFLNGLISEIRQTFLMVLALYDLCNLAKLLNLRVSDSQP